jgi:hypothetical protein
MYIVLLLGHVDSFEHEQPEMTSTQLGREGRRRVDFVQAGETAALRGRLSLPGGAPLANATVSLAHPGNEEMSGWKAAASGPDGTYELEDVEPGDYLVHIGVGSGLVLQGELHIEAGAREVRDFELAGGTLRVRVSDELTGGRLDNVLLLLGRHVQPNGPDEFPALEPLIGKTWTTGGACTV